MMLKTKIVMGWLAIAVGMATVALEACSNSDPAASPAPDGKGQSCVPGQQSPCACLGGASGVQVCEPSGASLGSCQCSSGGNDAASSADTGGSDAGNDAAVPIPTSGLVAYYRGDGKDKSGNLIDLTGGMPLTTDRFGGSQAGKIVVSNEGVLTRDPHPLIPKSNEPFSISVWGRFEAGVPLVRWNGHQLSMMSTVATLNTTNQQGNGVETKGTKALSVGPWHHIVLTFDGTNATLIVDDALDVSKDLELFISPSAGIFELGNPCRLIYPAPPNCSTTGGEHVGSIDDVRIYNRVLTQPEINALYHEAK